MGRRQVRHDVGHHLPVGELAVDVGGVPDETDDARRPGRERRGGERLVEVVGDGVEVSPAEGPGALDVVDLDDDAPAARHGDGERLRRAHAAEAGREHEPPGE